MIDNPEENELDLEIPAWTFQHEVLKELLKNKREKLKKDNWNEYLKYINSNTSPDQYYLENLQEEIKYMKDKKSGKCK
jgi:C4-dicarboxylate-specific signal transduction histidine kinase